MYFRNLLICLCLIAAHGSALADPGDVIGATVTIVNEVTGEFKQNVRNLETGDDVLQDEVIAVGTDSIGELMLRDETKVALGPGARLVLDRFVYDPNKTSGAIVLNLIKGGFRFITGVAAKPFYMIRTPIASITVRGTIFDIYIEEAGALWLLLHEGSIRACNDRGQCRNLDDPCRVLRIGPGGIMEDPGTWNALPNARQINFESAFPFVAKPPEIDPHPIFTRADIELGRCPERKMRKAEDAKPKARSPRKVKHTYARPRPKTYPKYSNPGFSIGIGIGIGGGGGHPGGHHGGHHSGN